MDYMENVLHGLNSCGNDDGHPDRCGRTECPYRDNGVWCTHELAHDAEVLVSELLKAQEPRVITLEEVRSRPYFGWIEERENIKTYIALFDFNEMSGLWPCAHVRDNRGNDTLLFFESYNKDWRCWTSKPTEDQRKNTPWMEGKSDENK